MRVTAPGHCGLCKAARCRPSHPLRRMAQRGHDCGRTFSHTGGCTFGHTAVRTVSTTLEKCDWAVVRGRGMGIDKGRHLDQVPPLMSPWKHLQVNCRYPPPHPRRRCRRRTSRRRRQLQPMSSPMPAPSWMWVRPAPAAVGCCRCRGDRDRLASAVNPCRVRVTV